MNITDTVASFQSNRFEGRTKRTIGRFVYSRRVQQMGFNGRYMFVRLNVNLSTK